MVDAETKALFESVLSLIENLTKQGINHEIRLLALERSAGAFAKAAGKPGIRQMDSE